MTGLRFYQHAVPTKVHRAVSFLYQKMNWEHETKKHVGQLAGVSASAIARWANRSEPSLGAIEACLNVFGYKLTVTRIDDGRK